MTLEEIKLCPTIDLLHTINIFEQEGNQYMVNICAFEMASRFFVPYSGQLFEEVLESFGYKNLSIEKEQRQVKKLELRNKAC